MSTDSFLDQQDCTPLPDSRHGLSYHRSDAEDKRMGWRPAKRLRQINRPAAAMT
jgi:hypothetical protein